MLSLQDKNMKLVVLGLATAAVVVGVCMNKKKLGDKSTLLCVALSVGVALLVGMNLKNEKVEPEAEGFYFEAGHPDLVREEFDSNPAPVPGSEESQAAEESASEDEVQPRNDAAVSQNTVESTPGPVKGPGCVQMDTVSPEDLLPNADSENIWDTPANPGDISGANFLDAGHHLGVNTVGQSLRNANRQLRSEPANPQVKVSPWLQSTIEPDCNRRPMEIGA